MKERFQLFVPVLVVLSGLFHAGCHDRTATSATRVAERPTPEKSFEEIVKMVKSGIEVGDGEPSAIVFQASGERSQITLKNEVTSALVPPAEGEPYRGTITVTSHTIYSLRRSIEAAEDKHGSEKSDDSQEATTQTSTDKPTSSVDVLDSNLVSAPAGSPKMPKISGDTVARRADDDQRVFELSYENGRWKQVTETDPKTEKAVQLAFDRALRAQP